MIVALKRVWTAAWVGVAMGLSQGILSALAAWEASGPRKEEEDMEDAEVEEVFSCSGDSETCLVDQCTECSERDCPFKCTMHYDDDGCPVCQEAS